MLRPKQIVPLYNGARAWLVAGTYKGSSLEEGPGNSDTSNFDDSRETNKGFLRRATPFNITKGNQCNDISGKGPEAPGSFKPHSGKPFPNASSSLTGEFSHQVRAVHGNAVEGLIEGPIPTKLSRPVARNNAVSSDCPQSRGDSSTNVQSSSAHNSASRAKLGDDSGKDDVAVFSDGVRKAGFAGAGRISDIQAGVKGGDGASHMVHRASRPNPAKQKPKAGSVERTCAPREASEHDVISMGQGYVCSKVGPKSVLNIKDGRQFSTLSESDGVEGQHANPLILLNDRLNQVNLGTQIHVAETPSIQEKFSHGMPVSHRVLSGRQAHSECQSTLHSPWRPGMARRGTQDAYHRANRQGRAGLHSSRSDGREVVERVCSILGQRAKWSPDIEVALSEVGMVLTPYHVNEVLKQQQEASLASAFFSWAKRQEGFKHDVHTYTTMVGILGRARRFDAVDTLLEEMAKDGCKPSVVTFNRLIHSYGRANQMVEALQIFHHMKGVGCVPDKVTYCTLIDLHAKAGFLDVAMDMYRQMRQVGLQPDTFTYSVMINCLGKAGELLAAQKILDEMIDRGCIPNLVTYNILIDLHAKSGKYDMALKLYNDMQETGFRPDHVTYSIVMEILGHAGHIEAAEHVFAEMQEAGWAADTTVYGLLVDMWGKAGNLEKACAWYNKMLESGVRPNVPTCNSLLGAFLRENLFEAGKQVLQDMADQRLVPSLQTYTLLLSCYTMSERAEEGEKIWSIMASLSHPAHTFLCGLPPARCGPNITWGYTIHFFTTISHEDQESKRSFTDATISFLHKVNMKAEAAIVWEVATENKIYPKAVTRKAANYWAINLHTMSMGTAIIALSRTLSYLKEGMLTTGIVPERIDIITGWGRRSRVTGSSLVKQAVEDILKAVSSPFRLESGNLGCFVGIGQPLADWLYESDMEHLHLI